MNPTVTADDGRTYTLRPKGICMECRLPIYDDPTATAQTGLCPCWDEPPRDWFLSLRPFPRDVGRHVAVVTLNHPIRFGRIIGWGSRCDPYPVLVAVEGRYRTIQVSPADCVLMEDPT